MLNNGLKQLEKKIKRIRKEFKAGFNQRKKNARKVGIKTKGIRKAYFATKRRQYNTKLIGIDIGLSYLGC